MTSGCLLADELWGDLGGEQQGLGATVHSCGMEQPSTSIGSHLWAMDRQWPSKRQPPLPSTLPKLSGHKRGRKHCSWP